MSSKKITTKGKIVLIVIIFVGLIGFIPIIYQTPPAKLNNVKKNQKKKKNKKKQPISNEMVEEEDNLLINELINNEMVEEEDNLLINELINNEMVEEELLSTNNQKQQVIRPIIPEEQQSFHSVPKESEYSGEPNPNNIEPVYREPENESETIFGSPDINVKPINNDTSVHDNIINDPEFKPIKQQIILDNVNKYLKSPETSAIAINDSVYINNTLVSKKENQNLNQIGIWYVSPNIFLKITDDITYLYIPTILKSYKPLMIEYNPKFTGGMFTSQFLDLLQNRSITFNYKSKTNEMILEYVTRDGIKQILYLKKISRRACNNIMVKIKQSYNKVNPNGLMMLLEIMNI